MPSLMVPTHHTRAVCQHALLCLPVPLPASSRQLFSVPFWRHFVAWLGSVPATKKDFKRALKRGSVAVIVSARGACEGASCGSDGMLCVKDWFPAQAAGVPAPDLLHLGPGIAPVCQSVQHAS